MFEIYWMLDADILKSTLNAQIINKQPVTAAA